MAGDKALREQEYQLAYWPSLGVASTVGTIYARRVAQSGGRLRRATFSVTNIEAASKGGTALLYVRGSAAVVTSASFTTSNQSVTATIKGGELVYAKGDVFTLRIKVAKATHSVNGVVCDYVCWEGA